MSEPAWTPEEQQILRREALIAKVIRLRAEAGPEKSPRPALLRVLESTGGAALITVLLGSLLAPIVISSIQRSRSRDDQALSEYRQYLERQQEAVKDSYDLIGRIVYASQNLISLTKPSFDLKRLSGEDQETVAKQKREMIENYNAMVREWRVRENMQGLLISYYFYGAPGVSDSWRGVQERVNEFLKCAQDRNESFLKDPAAVINEPDQCGPKKEAVRGELGKLARSIEVSRQYTWQRLDVPAPQAMSPHPAPPATLSPTATP